MAQLSTDFSPYLLTFIDEMRFFKFNLNNISFFSSIHQYSTTMQPMQPPFWRAHRPPSIHKCSVNWSQEMISSTMLKQLQQQALQQHQQPREQQFQGSQLINRRDWQRHPLQRRPFRQQSSHRGHHQRPPSLRQLSGRRRWPPRRSLKTALS